MTASLARNEKVKAALGRCLIATAFTQRQQRRVSNFVSPDRAGLSPRLYPADGAPGGRVVERVGSDATADFIARENLSLTLRRQPASDALREGSESAPCVRLHAHSMEKTNAERVASAYVNARE